MDKNTLLFIFILFLLSSQLLNISWDIGKGSIYIVITLLVLNTISPDTSDLIKSILIRIINFDTSIFKDILSLISKFFIGLFYYEKYNLKKMGLLQDIKSLNENSLESNPSILASLEDYDPENPPDN